MSGVETRGNKLRGWVSVGIFVMIGSYLVFKPDTKTVEPNILPTPKPKIDRSEPAEVISSRTTSVGGSRLVIRQCMRPDDCVTGTYASRFPEASLVYPAGSTMELEDVDPPMHPVPGR